MGHPLQSATSLNSANYVSSGNLPNEFISITFPGGISSFEIAGDPAGGSFAMDDFTFTAVPEPRTYACAALFFLLLVTGREVCRRTRPS